MNVFSNRVEAGKALALAVVQKNYTDPVVLALPRGGVPIGVEVARSLKAPLDLIMVRKIGVPRQPEVAAAAVVNGDDPKIVVNKEIAKFAGLDKADLDRLAKVQLAEIKRRRSIYLKDRTQITIQGRTAIIVDDGIATGATIKASLLAAKRREPAKLVLAVPIAPADTLEELRSLVDEIICLEAPDPFYAIGNHYADFRQVSDKEVVRLLDELGT